ncbi:hypothetical protein [Salinicola peritrichatus]|uniref:hypothetical protein n=1 Tax=Salinicola peritrichatus TaxID=1267424 RepID=UPI000DA13105|nr:hypothetical protein [Salinicola peritrichatus]
MKVFKKSLLALAVAASTLSPLAMAAATPEQSQPSVSEDTRHHRGNPLKEAVVASWNLSDDQLASLAQADSDFHAGLRQLHGDDVKASPDQRRAALESLLEKQRDQLSGVLSDEQLHAYQMMERPRALMMRHHEHGPRPDPEQMAERWAQRFEPLFASWNLSEQQSAEVRNAERTFFDGLHQLKRPDVAAPDARGAQFKQLLEQRHAALSEALDDEQLSAYEALTKPPRGPHHGPRYELQSPKAG